MSVKNLASIIHKKDSTVNIFSSGENAQQGDSMSVEYEMTSKDGFIMQVNFMDCNLDPAVSEGIFDYMKNEKTLIEYLRKVLPKAKVKKIIKNSPNKSL